MPIRRRVHIGTELTAVAQTLLTFSTNLTEGGGVLRNVTIINRDGATHRVTVHLVPLAASPTESNAIFEEEVPPKTTTIIHGPWFAESEAFVSAVSDLTDSNVGIRLTALEVYQP